MLTNSTWRPRVDFPDENSKISSIFLPYDVKTQSDESIENQLIPDSLYSANTQEDKRCWYWLFKTCHWFCGCACSVEEVVLGQSHEIFSRFGCVFDVQSFPFYMFKEGKQKITIKWTCTKRLAVFVETLSSSTIIVYPLITSESSHCRSSICIFRVWWCERLSLTRHLCSHSKVNNVSMTCAEFLSVRMLSLQH